MDFKITEAEACEMARFEEEAGGDISAGVDWGIHLGRVMRLGLDRSSQGRFIDLLSEQFGDVMSVEEI